MAAVFGTLLTIFATMFALAAATPTPGPQSGGFSYPGCGSPSGGASASGSAWTGCAGSGSGSSSSSRTGGPGSFGAGSSAAMDKAVRTRAVHGILAAVAMVVLFPTGAMLVRVLPGRVALWMHALTQITALGVFAGAVGFGVQLVQEVREKFGLDLMREPNTNYHAIIGLVVLACLVAQPVLGLIHHQRFRRLQRRQIWSYLHLFNGRIPITLGIVNGALGLWIARASDRLKVAYLATAGAMWALWMMIAVFAEWKRWRKGTDRQWSWKFWSRRKVDQGDITF